MRLRHSANRRDVSRRTLCALLALGAAASTCVAAETQQERPGWAQYFERYIACGETEYLQRVGGESAVKALPLPVF